MPSRRPSIPDPTDPSTSSPSKSAQRVAGLAHTSLHALPMYLGLDLRGGVHFLLRWT